MPHDLLIRLALDQSVRRYDQDGRLHVKVSHLTKSCVNPYKGSEIPDAEKLGLKADQVYQLFRDPGELQKAVPTFNNIPVLDQHVPVTAQDAKRERVIGSTGTDARWNPPYIDNSLVFWDDKAIALIESGQQRELSSAYRYIPIMRPGVFEGQRFDGVMTQIRANHVAIVEDGRAGSDVVVMDSKPKEIEMRTTPLSPRAAFALGHFNAVIPPLLAADQKMPDLAPVFRGVTAKNWAQRKDGIAAAIIRKIRPVLAQDAEIHIHEHMDGVGAGAPDQEVPQPMQGPPGGPPGANQDEGEEGAMYGELDPEGTNAASMAAEDDDLEMQIRQLLEGKLDPADIEQLLALMRPEGAKATDPGDQPPEDNGGPSEPPPEPQAAPPDDNGNNGDRGRGARDRGAKDRARGARDQNPAPPDQTQPVLRGSGDKGARDQNPPPPDQDQPAMDAKIKLATDRAIAAERARQNAIRDAERRVRPWIGEIQMAQDSAVDIYKLALDTHGVSYDEVHQDAGTLWAMLQLVPKPGEAQTRAPRLAQDAKRAGDAFLERFPMAKTARVLG